MMMQDWSDVQIMYLQDPECEVQGVVGSQHIITYL